MDPVTHTLIGVGMANAFFRRRVGPEAVTLLAIASNLPDIDVLAHLTGDPTAVLMRRTFGHSLLLIPFWAAALGLILKRFYPKHGFKTLFGLSLLGALAHVFFDLVNSFGVVLLWPISYWRPELAILFIIDLALTGLLLAPLLICIPKTFRPHLVRLSQVSILLVAVYVIFCGMNRMLAQQALAKSLPTGTQAEFTYVFPEPLGPHRWRGVVREGNRYEISLIHSLSGRIDKKGTAATSRGDPIVEQARSTRLAQRLEWFFKAPIWEVRAHNPAGGVSENPIDVTVYDLRFRPVLVERGSAFVYRFGVYNDGRVEAMGWSDRYGKQVHPDFRKDPPADGP